MLFRLAEMVFLACKAQDFAIDMKHWYACHYITLQNILTTIGLSILINGVIYTGL